MTEIKKDPELVALFDGLKEATPDLPQARRDSLVAAVMAKIETTPQLGPMPPLAGQPARRPPCGGRPAYTPTRWGRRPSVMLPSLCLVMLILGMLTGEALTTAPQKTQLASAQTDFVTLTLETSAWQL